MPVRDWIAILAEGDLTVNLPVLRLVQAGSPRFSGSGRLVWNRTSGLKIHAVTDGADELRQQFGQADASVGKLIPLEKYVSATGQTQDGWDVSTIAAPREGYSVGLDSPHVLWDMATGGLTMTHSLQARAKPHRRTIRALLEPPPKHWPRSTSTEVHNEVFRGSSSKPDWLNATTALGALVARQYSDRFFEAQLVLNSDTAPEDPFQIIHAVAQAFSFIVGRRIWIHGLEDINGCGLRRELYPYRAPTENSLRPPLGNNSTYLENVETLLGKAVDFFLTAQGVEVAQYLDLCWDTTDNDFNTSVTAVAITLESLLRVAGKRLTIDEPGHTADDRDALRSWIEARAGLRTKRFLERVRGFVNNISQPRPIDVLWSWHNEGLLGITPEDVAAWKQSRNPAAHGSLAGKRLSREELQRRFDRFVQVQNLVNRIVLHLIGYHGRYVDYSQVGWPEAEFPHPKPAPGPKGAAGTA
jgi:hypothetical protein